jgi:hypothetical protein
MQPDLVGFGRGQQIEMVFQQGLARWMMHGFHEPRFELRDLVAPPGTVATPGQMCFNLRRGVVVDCAQQVIVGEGLPKFTRHLSLPFMIAIVFLSMVSMNLISVKLNARG